MPISITVLLVLAGVVLLAFGIGSTGGALRFLSGGFALLVAIVSTAATIGLFWLGQKNDWTSDGPGILFVMIAVVVFAVVAVVAWLFVFGIAMTAAAPVTLPEAPRDSKRVFRLVGFALLAVAVVGQGIAAYSRRGRAAHRAPVVAVSFASEGSRLVTADEAGSLVGWDLHPKRVTDRKTVSSLAGMTELCTDVKAEHGFAIANGQAVHFAPFRDTPIETIPEARHIACGAAVVVAKERAVLLVPYDDWTKPAHLELAWPEPITAIAARDMFVAVADRVSLSLLAGRPRYARTLARMPVPGPIRRLEVLNDGVVLALDGAGAGWAVEVRRGTTQPLAAGASLAAAGGHTLLVSGRTVSEYDFWRKTTTPVGNIRAGARSVETAGKHIAFGFEDGEVVLAKRIPPKMGARTGPQLETQRLTARPDGR